MIKIIEKSKCSGCHACFSACPKNCIVMLKDEEGFLYPKVNESDCIDCGLCEKVCPILNNQATNKEMPTAFAAKNPNEVQRKESSSGGIFSLIANKILSSGGKVFGASFDDDFNVVHVGISNAEGLNKLRGSKYVQSVIGDVFKEVKTELDLGTEVLFSGTPCQVEGLKSYLRKDYSNLFLVDLICHGVPSSNAWQKYLSDLETKYNSKIAKVTFRNKEQSWKRYSICITFDSGEQLIQKFNENNYMKAFLRNFCLRPSCYTCNFKGLSRKSDITLADFWGIESVLPVMDDDKGTSLVLAHTQKGKDLIDEIDATVMQVDPHLAIRENTSAVKSSSYSKYRDKFFKEIKSKPFNKVVKKYTKVKLWNRLKTKIKSILKRGQGGRKG